MNRRTPLKAMIAAVALALAVALIACGEDDESTAGSEPAGNGTDRAFAAEMVPHHESAVAMAEVAGERGERSQIKQLADDIVRSQNEEIGQLQAIDQRLEEAGVESGDLGMDDDEMGTDMDATMLEDAEPFDREFIDMMIPHHRSAIEMARMELEQGGDSEAQRLAQAIIDAQTAEIDQMNEWRVEWYGEISPAGGVPEDTESHGGGHDG